MSTPAQAFKKSSRDEGPGLPEIRQKPAKKGQKSVK